MLFWLNHLAFAFSKGCSEWPALARSLFGGLVSIGLCPSLQSSSAQACNRSLLRLAFGLCPGLQSGSAQVCVRALPRFAFGLCPGLPLEHSQHIAIGSRAVSATGLCLEPMARFYAPLRNDDRCCSRCGRLANLFGSYDMETGWCGWCRVCNADWRVHCAVLGMFHRLYIDFWSPKSANLGSQNPPQWSQEGPSLIKNVILSKSKNPSKVLENQQK